MNRVALINHLIQRGNYRTYLEIGCANNGTFRRIQAACKVGIDPRRGGTLRMSSDTFFRVNQQKFDIVFVDRLHHCEQVFRDVENSCRWLAKNGCIVIHDCLPERPEHQDRKPARGEKSWTGDVWKAIVQLRQSPDHDIAVLNNDWGLGVLFPRPNTNRLLTNPELTWETYIADRNELLRVVDLTGLRSFLSQNDG